MAAGSVEIPDYRDWLLAEATENCNGIGLVLNVVPGESGDPGGGSGDEPRIERNADDSQPGTQRALGGPVNVMLYPNEGRQ